MAYVCYQKHLISANWGAEVVICVIGIIQVVEGDMVIASDILGI